jgi:hypothetical protein
MKLTCKVSKENLVLSQREEGSVVQSEPVVQLFVHDLCLESHNQFLLFLLFLVELQVLALALLNNLMHGVVILVGADRHPLGALHLLVMLH